jgi:small conductance mechanosensitive channel
MGSKIQRNFFGVLISTVILLNLLAIPTWAQLPLLPKLNLSTLIESDSANKILSVCVHLDGSCLFELSDQKSDLGQRINYVEEQLAEIKNTYLNADSVQLSIVAQGDQNRQSLTALVGSKKIPVLTLKPKDIKVDGIDLETQAEQIGDRIKRGLEKAKLERQPAYLFQQAKLAGAGLLLMVLSNFMLWRWIKRLTQTKVTFSQDADLPSQLEQRRTLNLKEVKYRLLQLVQLTVWIGGILIILGLFPQTRLIQLWSITILRIPLQLMVVIWVCYVLIRLSYAAIAKINAAITNDAFTQNYLLNNNINQRLQVRVNTFSRLFRGIMTFIWAGIALFISLSMIGFNVTPLLAGAGVLGLAFSFASQNLIKDTINGLLIIFEDQYAVGDVVTIGEVGGLVENLNLRITQLRDGEGRLITIPNSSISVVANHSNGWSRSDLKIPVAYYANVDEAIALIKEIAEQMYQDCECRTKILEPPQVLGVEDFAERGFIIRLWFKTEPLRQWEISREFRRRLKNAFEAAGIPLPLPQQQIWLSRHNLVSDQKN